MILTKSRWKECKRCSTHSPIRQAGCCCCCCCCYCCRAAFSSRLVARGLDYVATIAWHHRKRASQTKRKWTKQNRGYDTAVPGTCTYAYVACCIRSGKLLVLVPVFGKHISHLCFRAISCPPPCPFFPRAPEHHVAMQAT